MLPQTHLSAEDRWAVIQYVKGFSERFAREDPAEPVRIPPPPADLWARRERGKQLYVDTGCIDCHGVEGWGDGPSARDLRDKSGYPIRPVDLTRRPLKGSSSPMDLYRTLITGLDGTPIPSRYCREMLTEEELVVVPQESLRVSPWNIQAREAQE